ncbi:MAG: desulfoferrodoxin [Ruminococcus sp.]|nr:desulfoferrodoxin [Ruminococcus sp.]
MKRKLLLCEVCGNLVELTNETEKELTCCGSKMKEIEANTTEAALEKHIPVIDKKDNVVIVTVGEVMHPMTEEHYIKWIYLETNKGIKKADLKPEMEPVVKFNLENDEEVIGAYSYCNLHSLWGTK